MGPVPAGRSAPTLDRLTTRFTPLRARAAAMAVPIAACAARMSGAP
jgi:hypothetical protein